MTDTLEDDLRELGLSGYQARVLIALALTVTIRPASSRRIAEWSGVPRTSVYGSVQRLVDLGLVDEVKGHGGMQWQFVGWDIAGAVMRSNAMSRQAKEMAVIAKVLEQA